MFNFNISEIVEEVYDKVSLVGEVYEKVVEVAEFVGQVIDEHDHKFY